ncbi:uncharacterized protein LOC114663082 [Erpetoichthys calabaricus]|uniref:uncharacterized protein LOC114663082 n=1 Tax=Erpetoichthys calabaricus TaxID=27687 RepID=UPI002234CB81|nr:uncharacterized protein LOC114663082 [Erpetoichthys calabaricus]
MQWLLCRPQFFEDRRHHEICVMRVNSSSSIFTYATVLILSSCLFGLAASDVFCMNKPDGVYGDPSHSSTIIFCRNGESILSKCPSGLVFNRELIECDYPSATTAGTGGSTENQNFCHSKPDGNYANASDPHSFIVCVNGNSFSFTCPQGLVYNQQKNQCDHPNLTTTDTVATATTTIKSSATGSASSSSPASVAVPSLSSGYTSSTLQSSFDSTVTSAITSSITISSTFSLSSSSSFTVTPTSIRSGMTSDLTASNVSSTLATSSLLSTENRKNTSLPTTVLSSSSAHNDQQNGTSPSTTSSPNSAFSAPVSFSDSPTLLSSPTTQIPSPSPTSSSKHETTTSATSEFTTTRLFMTSSSSSSPSSSNDIATSSSNFNLETGTTTTSMTKATSALKNPAEEQMLQLGVSATGGKSHQSVPSWAIALMVVGVSLIILLPLFALLLGCLIRRVSLRDSLSLYHDLATSV